MNPACLMLPLPVVSSILRVFNPDSPQARSILDLGITAGLILATIYLIVGGMILYALLRFRQRKGDENQPDPPQHAGNRTIEIIWTLIPFIIVVTLFFLTARTMSQSDPPPAPEPDIIVIGHQWWWEIRYPKLGIVTANEMHIPVGKALSIRVESSDVLHEFWAPELTRKITAVPGRENHIWLQADTPGSTLGVCSEFCGTQHAWMHLLIISEPEAAFTAWTEAQRQPAAVPASGIAERGMAIFGKMSCVTCHTISGTTAQGKAGPDLTHFASRRQLGAGIVDNTEENLHRWLTDPHDIKRGVLMPNLKLTDEQVAELTAYLRGLK